MSAPPYYHLAHIVISYRVACSRSCKGTVSFEVYARPPHGASVQKSSGVHVAGIKGLFGVRVVGLNKALKPFSITSASGGESSFSERLSAPALRRLRALLRAHDVVTIVLEAKADEGASAGRAVHVVP
jgi:hypothetical protein